MTESQLQSKMIKYLKEKGYFVIKTIRTNNKGTPDLIVCDKKGRFYGIEVKRTGLKHTTTELQKYTIDLINKTGGVAFVADSIKDLQDKGL